MIRNVKIYENGSLISDENVEVINEIDITNNNVLDLTNYVSQYCIDVLSENDTESIDTIIVPSVDLLIKLCPSTNLTLTLVDGNYLSLIDSSLVLDGTKGDSAIFEVIEQDKIKLISYEKFK